jgi:hypothetical protein
MHRIVWIVTVIALCYSAAHFIQSGVIFPIHQANIAKFEEETPALREHIRTGEPVHFGNPVQYGPVFFFVMHPLLVHTQGNAERLSNALYAIQLPCIALALLLTFATLKPLVRAADWPLTAAWIVVLWMNFAPLYTILAVKSVETWELLLLSLALYGYVREKLWLLGIAIAAAALGLVEGVVGGGEEVIEGAAGLAGDGDAYRDGDPYCRGAVPGDGEL